MASSRDYERRLESVASVAKIVPEIEEGIVLPREISMNQGTEGHTNTAKPDIHYYRDLARRLKDQRDEARSQTVACEQELAYLKDDLADAKTRIQELEDEITVLENEARTGTTSFEREQTTETATSVANWRARGHDPADLLTGKMSTIMDPGVMLLMRSSTSMHLSFQMTDQRFATR
jgi:septal ring factor EnvC (AmiA/AmiB activator)